MPEPTDRKPTDLVTRTFELRAVEGSDRSFDVVASDETVDSYGTRLIQNWRLERFLANPVVLWAHDSCSLPLGTASDVRMENGALCMRVTLVSSELNPIADAVLGQVRAGVLRGVSVGFLPHGYRWAEEKDAEILELDDNELVELSITPTPANPNALVALRARALGERRTAGGQSPAPPAPRSLLAALGVETEAEAIGAVAALRERSSRVTALEGEVSTLRRRHEVELAVRDGIVSREWASTHEADSEEALRGALSALRAVGVRGVQMAPKPQPAPGATSTLTEADRAMARQLGLTDEQMTATRRAEQEAASSGEET